MGRFNYPTETIGLANALTARYMEKMDKEIEKYKTKSKKPQKKSPDMQALIQAVEDGRIVVGLTWDGDVAFKNMRSKRIYIIDSNYVLTYDETAEMQDDDWEPEG